MTAALVIDERPPRFGWCTTDQHKPTSRSKGCPGQFTSQGKTHRCGCTCHNH